mgnify:CR=1
MLGYQPGGGIVVVGVRHHAAPNVTRAAPHWAMRRLKRIRGRRSGSGTWRARRRRKPLLSECDFCNLRFIVYDLFFGGDRKNVSVAFLPGAAFLVLCGISFNPILHPGLNFGCQPADRIAAQAPATWEIIIPLHAPTGSAAQASEGFDFGFPHEPVRILVLDLGHVFASLRLRLCAPCAATAFQ